MLRITVWEYPITENVEGPPKKAFTIPLFLLRIATWIPEWLLRFIDKRIRGDDMPLLPVDIPLQELLQIAYRLSVDLATTQSQGLLYRFQDKTTRTDVIIA
jgi:hypothetical protein